MFSWRFAYAHFAENILEDVPQNLASLGCILSTVTKEKCEKETMRKNGIKEKKLETEISWKR